MRDQLSDAPTFWMNVTTSANWQRSPVGIVRVEQEVRRRLAETLQNRLQPIVFQDGKFVREMATSSRAARAPDDFWPEPSYGSSADIFDLLRSPAAAPSGSALSTASRRAPEFGYGDVLVTMGLDWEYPGLHDEIRRLASVYNLTVIACCYDLIPVLFPQYCVGDVSKWFKNYFIEMTWAADGVLCISENTRRDYLELARSLGLPPRRTDVIELGSSLPPRIEGAPVSKEVEQVLGGRFFLFVSTIERRKNHEVLYRAYHLLRQEHPGADLPRLVFVGMEGWGVSDLMSDIRLDPLTKRDIVILPHVSDSELSLLYAQCEAFLYPSHYEGWGLPVAEALQLGRPVFASGAGSIPEVGGALVRYLDPWSPRAWADELLKIARNETDLECWSRKIAETFKPYQWSSAAQTLIGMANDLRQTKSPTRVLEAGYDLSTVNGVHYGDKIIYRGRQGIVCHGPYLGLAPGLYEVRMEIDWVDGAPGFLRLKATHNRGDSRLTTKVIETGSLRPGPHELALRINVPAEIEDFEVVCEVDCASEVRLSVDKVHIRRIAAAASPAPADKVRATA